MPPPSRASTVMLRRVMSSHGPVFFSLPDAACFAGDDGHDLQLQGIWKNGNHVSELQMKKSKLSDILDKELRKGCGAPSL
uniref:Uncharacterized protein n=1 Tax=Oryza barthii TaxID=65489 RepID=A0A0D3F0B0_9ORYZ